MNKNRIFFTVVLMVLTAMVVNAQYKFKVEVLDFDKSSKRPSTPIRATTIPSW